MISEVSAVVAAVMSCISAYFSMMAATVNTRHWMHIKRRKHDLFFIVSSECSTWTLHKILADMKGVLPDERGLFFPVSADSETGRMLKALTFCVDVVDDEPIVYGNLDSSVCIAGVRDWLMVTKWFSLVGYTNRGKKRLKREIRNAKRVNGKCGGN